MGNWTSKDKSANEAEEERKKQDAERIRREELEKEKIRKENAAKIEIEKKRLASEIEEEYSVNLKKTVKSVASYNERKAVGEKYLEEINRKLKETTEVEIQQLKNDGVAQVTESKEQLQTGKEELVKDKEQLTYELNRLYESKQESIREEKRMKEEMREQEEEDVRRRQAEMLDLQKQMADVQVDGERQKKELAVKRAEEQKAVAVEHIKLEAAKLEDAHALMDASSKEMKYENFRRDSRGMIRLSKAFKDNFDLEETSLISTKDEIEQGIPVTMAPDFTFTLRALRSFVGELREFSVEGASDPKTFENLRETVKNILNKLITSLGTTTAKIRGYQNASSQQFMGDDTASEHFSISILYDEIKKLIAELSTEILKFNVRASTYFDDTLARQSVPLSIRVREKEHIAQIASASKTETAMLEPDKED